MIEVPRLTLAKALELKARGGTGNTIRAVKSIQALARDGDVGAQFALARICERGEGLKTIEPRKAVFWADRAAKGGSADAMVLLGLYWTIGFGVDADRSAARRLLKRSAAAGSPLGALLLVSLDPAASDIDERTMEKALGCTASDIAPFADLLKKSYFPEKAWKFLRTIESR